MGEETKTTHKVIKQHETQSFAESGEFPLKEAKNQSITANTKLIFLILLFST
jgi:hypothetical protein